MVKNRGAVKGGGSWSLTAPRRASSLALSAEVRVGRQGVIARDCPRLMSSLKWWQRCLPLWGSVWCGGES